jgi:hypothetical protein
VLTFSPRPETAPTHEDGRVAVLHLYYSRDGNIWRKPVSGGEQELLVNGLSGWSDFAVVEQGIFFVARANPGKRQSIRFYRFSTGQIHAITDPAKPIFAGLTASADGRSILYSQVDRNESDLMLVDLPR